MSAPVLNLNTPSLILQEGSPVVDPSLATRSYVLQARRWPCVFGLGLALFSLGLCVPAQAGELAAKDVAVAPSIVCDTQRDMERFVALYENEDDQENALNKVNAEVRNPRACMAGIVAFIRGPVVAVAEKWNESVHIMRVIIVGVLTRGGLRMTSPAPAFSIERVPERGA